MKPDEIIIVPRNIESKKDALRELFVRGDTLVEKYLQPPVSARLLDGHGNQLVAFEVD